MCWPTVWRSEKITKILGEHFKKSADYTFGVCRCCAKWKHSWESFEIAQHGNSFSLLCWWSSVSIVTFLHRHSFALPPGDRCRSRGRQSAWAGSPGWTCLPLAALCGSWETCSSGATTPSLTWATTRWALPPPTKNQLFRVIVKPKIWTKGKCLIFL